MMKNLLKTITIFFFVVAVVFGAGCAGKKTTESGTQEVSQTVTPEETKATTTKTNTVASENMTENKIQGVSKPETATTSAETHSVTPAAVTENVTENNTAKVNVDDFSEVRKRDLEVVNMSRSNSSASIPK